MTAARNSSDQPDSEAARALQIIESMPGHAWSADAAGRLTYVSPRTLAFLGCAREDLDISAEEDGFSWRRAVHPDDYDRAVAEWRHCLETGDHYQAEHRLRRADGVYRWFRDTGRASRDSRGQITAWYGVSLDIDDEMRAQEALRERERELSLLVDMVPSHLWRVAPNGATTLANKHMADFLGTDLGDTQQIEEAFDTIFHPDEKEAVWEVFERCLRTGEPFSMKYRLRRADGVYRWMSGRAEPMRDESGRIVQWFGLCHDIDDQVHAEAALRRISDQLARATQAASMAELSASIAHEINQPLAAVAANSQACQRWLSAEVPNIERAKIAAERITREAMSAANVVSHIRALFRQAPRARSSEDINLLIAEVCRLLANEVAARGVRLETELEAGLPSAALDRVQVQQVLVNLIRNGIEAMDTTADGPHVLRVRSCRDGLEAIRVEVRDTGTGFKDAERVFEPFFTTKPDGMGMGLAICRSIVESHEGRLWTADNETQGATVAFTLPLTVSQAP